MIKCKTCLGFSVLFLLITLMCIAMAVVIGLETDKQYLAIPPGILALISAVMVAKTFDVALSGDHS